MSRLTIGEAQYDPGKEYFFVDYLDRLEIRHIRCAFMTIEEVQDLIINDLPFVYDPDEAKSVPMFSNLRVTPMSNLEELNQSWNHETGQYEDDEITVARKQFGSLYDGYDWIEHPSLLPSLTKSEEETTEEWKSRVEAQRNELKKRRAKETEAFRTYRQKVRETYPNYEQALLLGSIVRTKELKNLTEEEPRKVDERYGLG
jgi:hypothetical protein